MLHGHVYILRKLELYALLKTTKKEIRLFLANEGLEPHVVAKLSVEYRIRINSRVRYLREKIKRYERFHGTNV